LCNKAGKGIDVLYFSHKSHRNRKSHLFDYGLIFLNEGTLELNRDHLETFAVITEVQSFEKAATLLNISRGAVSQRIKALEDALSTVLLVRDQPARPTVRGQILLRHVQALRLLEDATLGELMPSSERAVMQVAIAVNADSLATWFPSVLWSLLREQRMAVEVVADDQEHTLQRLTRGEVMGCISTASNPATGFDVSHLGCMEYRCYATRSFAAKHFPQGINVGEARKAPALLFNRKDSLHDDFLANLFGYPFEKYIKHYVPASVTLLDGVVEGVGYGLVPSMQVIHHPYKSELVDIAPERPVLVPMYWHHWLSEPPQLKLITKLVTEIAAGVLRPAPGKILSAQAFRAD
jgi:LysR family transcriptional regulator (chromosome initiation inhibitor)